MSYIKYLRNISKIPIQQSTIFLIFKTLSYLDINMIIMEVFLAPDRKIWKFRYYCNGG